jgi:putative endonuclease
MSRPPRTAIAGWSDPRHRLGLDGEAEALAYLVANGWQIAAHRFRIGRNEIDLIARQGSLVAFVEVKTRGGEGFGAGREAIGWRKRRAIGRVAEAWRLRNGRPGDSYRFDLVEIIRERGRQLRIEHVADAWRLGP